LRPLLGSVITVVVVCDLTGLDFLTAPELGVGRFGLRN
jgi:hypothetical protein